MRWSALLVQAMRWRGAPLGQAMRWSVALHKHCAWPAVRGRPLAGLTHCEVKGCVDLSLAGRKQCAGLRAGSGEDAKNFQEIGLAANLSCRRAS